MSGRELKRARGALGGAVSALARGSGGGRDSRAAREAVAVAARLGRLVARCEVRGAAVSSTPAFAGVWHDRTNIEHTPGLVLLANGEARMTVALSWSDRMTPGK